MIAGEVKNLTSIAYYIDSEVGEKDESRMTLRFWLEPFTKGKKSGGAGSFDMSFYVKLSLCLLEVHF